MDDEQQKVVAVITERINMNGHDPSSVQVVQKARDAWLCTVNFPDDDLEYHGVVTRDELA